MMLEGKSHKSYNAVDKMYWLKQMILIRFNTVQEASFDGNNGSFRIYVFVFIIGTYRNDWP